MTNLKKILFVNTDLRGGGAEKILVNILNSFDYSKYDVTVLTIFKEGVNREDLNKEIKQKWIFKKPFKGYTRLALLFSPQFLFKQFIKSDEYDVIISFLEGFPSRIVSGCKNPNIKLISWIHLELYENTIGYEFRNKSEAVKCYHKFHKIVSVAKTVQDHFTSCVDIPKERLAVIYNPLEIEEIITKAEQNPYQKIDKIRLVTVGRLNPQKGYDRLVRIMKKLKADGFDFELNILGMGPMEAELKKYVIENDLSTNINFLGFQKNPYPYIKYADIFVCSSHKEGYSTVVTESVILETPVITTNCSGMDEILDNGNAGVIIDNTEDALYDGLKKLLNNSENLSSLKEKTSLRANFLKNRNSMNQIIDIINSK